METAVGTHGDARGDWSADRDVGGAGVEFLGRLLIYVVPLLILDGAIEVVTTSTHLTKVHRLNTLRSKRRTDRWRWRGLAGSNDELDDHVCCLLGFRHCGGVWVGVRLAGSFFDIRASSADGEGARRMRSSAPSVPRS